MVTIAAGAASQPHAEAVAVVVTNFFAAINNHDYLAYRSLFSASLQHFESPQRFRAGYRTTADSAATIESIAAAGAGRLAATVTFTSRQAAADSPDHATCNRWRITLFLVRGGSYLIGESPPGYQPSYRNCPQAGR